MHTSWPYAPRGSPYGPQLDIAFLTAVQVHVCLPQGKSSALFPSAHAIQPAAFPQGLQSVLRKRHCEGQSARRRQCPSTNEAKLSQRHPRHAEIHKAHAEVDPVRRNSPQSDQTGESFLLTGRFRNYSCEVCEFRVSAGETSDSFYWFFLKREVQFSLYHDFTTIRLRGFHP